MTISELICHLQQIKCEHGDLEVIIMSNGIGYQAYKVTATIACDGVKDFQAACICGTRNRKS